MSTQTLRRAAALFEVLGVVLVGPLVSDLLVKVSGMAVSNPLDNSKADVTNAGLLTASRQMFVLLMFTYVGMVVTAVAAEVLWRREPVAGQATVSVA